jgi:pckA: phosphoenolpyruvate carboxykinase (ATP)
MGCCKSTGYQRTV